MGDSVVPFCNKEEMKLILSFMVLLVSALMTSATMNVGTFWFAQNNGKFYPVGGSGNGYYDQISSRSDLEGGNGNRLQEQEQEGHPIEVSSFVENLRNRMADHLQQQYMIQQQQENNEGRKRRYLKRIPAIPN